MSDSLEDGNLVAQLLEAENRMRRGETGEGADAPKPKKERKPRQRAPEPEPEDNAAHEQMVSITAAAITATGSGLVDAFDLEPEFTEAHGQVLAEAWVPVMDYYAGESENPLVPALLTTLITLGPYFWQILTREPEGEDVSDLSPSVHAQS